MSDTIPQDSQNFKVRDFEGPLDLLLFLIKKNEINIYDIPIAEIVEQYLTFLSYATKVNLENITEFYLMASTLLYIKSRMLLPVEIDFNEEFEDPRKELVDRLIEYQKFRKISELISEKEQETEWIIERSKQQRILPFPEDDLLWERIDVWDLLKTFNSLISSLSAERIVNLFEEVTINEKISLINEFLETKGEFLFSDLISSRASTLDIICSFLAILESVKSRRISIYQNKLFGDIRITAYKTLERGLSDQSSDQSPGIE